MRNSDAPPKTFGMQTKSNISTDAVQITRSSILRDRPSTGFLHRGKRWNIVRPERGDRLEIRLRGTGEAPIEHPLLAERRKAQPIRRSPNDWSRSIGRPYRDMITRLRFRPLAGRAPCASTISPLASVSPTVGCRGPRPVDSIVDGNAVQPAISRCPQSSDCCPPSVGILSALRRIPHARRKSYIEKLDLLLAESLRSAHEAGALRTKDLKRVTVDTTVQRTRPVKAALTG
jgi:hypothetical protein